MVVHLPIPLKLDASRYQFGKPQSSGALTIVPIFGPDRQKQFSPPLSALKQDGVQGYGNIKLKNLPGLGTAIVPLHIGYIQDGAQNHAMCRSGFIGENQSVMFKDACCVQAAQGGYLESKQQWFFILPLWLREAALQLRHQEGFSKLWGEISALNELFGAPSRGHLEHIVVHERPYLNQYANRFELLPRQTGALFLLCDKLVGIELAPSVDYFAECWRPLVCFSYGSAAMYEERFRHKGATLSLRSMLAAHTPLVAERIDTLREQFVARRERFERKVHDVIQSAPSQKMQSKQEESFLRMRLSTLENPAFLGQVAHQGDDLVYASLFARRQFLH